MLPHAVRVYECVQMGLLHNVWLLELQRSELYNRNNLRADDSSIDEEQQPMYEEPPRIKIEVPPEYLSKINGTNFISFNFMKKMFC